MTEDALWITHRRRRARIQQPRRRVAYCSNKAGVFRANAPEPQSGDGLTQFGRALSELIVDVICANTPALKGRVEREERKVTKQLSLNYRRVMYLLVPTEAAKKTQGRRMQVYEDGAGNIEIRDGTVVLQRSVLRECLGL
jgi:hypothetical protein